MTERWLPIVAEVEWHAGYRAFERPSAVLFAGERVEVVVEASTAVGPTAAGPPSRRVFVVRDGRGRAMRITVDGEGRSRVEVARPG